MNYMGGKHRQGKAIAELLSSLVGDLSYYEPFCGALGVASRAVPLIGPNKAVLSDCNKALITMWLALAAGWVPPDVVTEAMYNKYKAKRDEDDPMTAYCGFGMAFGGELWGTYAREERVAKSERAAMDYANEKRSKRLKQSTMRKSAAVFGSKVISADYREYDAVGLYYMDPPYAGRRNKYGPRFDSTAFWEHCESLVKGGSIVVVTEFVAPDGWTRVHNFGDTVVRHYAGTGKDGTCESIFMHESQQGNN